MFDDFFLGRGLWLSVGILLAKDFKMEAGTRAAVYFCSGIKLDHNCTSLDRVLYTRLKTCGVGNGKGLSKYG